jgi:hypothetical protein
VVDPSFDAATIPNDMPGPAIQMIATVHQSILDPAYVQGPCHIVTGHDSLRACTAVAAFAQALQQTQKAAVVLYAKTRSVVATRLGALLPSADGQHLYLVTLPYQKETKQLAAADCDWQQDEDDLSDEQMQIASDLVDSLWLTDHQAETILHQADPFQRAWMATVWERAVHPQHCTGTTENPLIVPRRLDEQDPLGTPYPVRQKAQPYIARFRDAFPLEKKMKDETKKEQGLKSLTYTNFVA